jgi:dolichol-phosphate mannosyltransferase
VGALIERTADRGLSAAVLDGLRCARGEIVLCMDADLSHPSSAIPLMVRKLLSGADFVVGSRYVDGGTTSHDWGFLRWLNSRIATWLARPLTNVRDPMAGSSRCAVRRSSGVRHSVPSATRSDSS